MFLISGEETLTTGCICKLTGTAKSITRRVNSTDCQFHPSSTFQVKVAAVQWICLGQFTIFFFHARASMANKNGIPSFRTNLETPVELLWQTKTQLQESSGKSECWIHVPKIWWSAIKNILFWFLWARWQISVQAGAEHHCVMNLVNIQRAANSP